MSAYRTVRAWPGTKGFLWGFDVMARLTLQPLKIATGGPDEDGVLVLANGHLVAVLIRLSPLHGELQGHWHLEFAPGITKSPPASIFADLDTASDWIAARLHT